MAHFDLEKPPHQFTAAEIDQFSVKERAIYEGRLIVHRDMKNVKDTAWIADWMQGWVRGWMQGWAEGRAEIKEEVIKNSLEQGIALETIAKIVRLPIEEVLQIIEKNK